jgi:hypothetical protein
MSTSSSMYWATAWTNSDSLPRMEVGFNAWNDHARAFSTLTQCTTSLNGNPWTNLLNGLQRLPGPGRLLRVKTLAQTGQEPSPPFSPTRSCARTVSLDQSNLHIVMTWLHITGKHSTAPLRRLIIVAMDAYGLDLRGKTGSSGMESSGMRRNGRTHWRGVLATRRQVVTLAHTLPPPTTLQKSYTRGRAGIISAPWPLLL